MGRLAGIQAALLCFLQAGCWQAVVYVQMPQDADGEASGDAADMRADETIRDLATDEAAPESPDIAMDRGDVESAGEEPWMNEDGQGEEPPQEDLMDGSQGEGDVEAAGEEPRVDEDGAGVETPDEDAADGADLEGDLDAESESGPVCGNGIVESGEECDGGPTGSCVSPCGTSWLLECSHCTWVCRPPSSSDCCACCMRCSSLESCCVCPEWCWCYEEPPEYYCGLGVCQRRAVCRSDGLIECTPGPPTGDDNDCNGLDDDCDGLCDNHYVSTTLCGLGACERGSVCSCGAETCTPGEPLAPDDATCDGVDDDCDGLVDEDCPG